MESITHAIKNPSRFRLIAAMTVSSSIWLIQVVHLVNRHRQLLSISISAILCLLCMSFLIAACYRASKRAAVLTLSNNQLRINGVIIEAEEIRSIHQTGYFSPLIGIKPRGKRIVPTAMCFRFAGDEDQGSADLAKWAAQHQVKIVNKPFMRWL
ncbi:hypothetical protein A8990_14931 [Paenibacillus taihuensis]|uniref:PH (Pleckstrin Homology) domain-containing protein n=1 Tax=Paenibacillus taihuensis TaxID=1156355 RepID=A0A3D9QTM9_9BACL|nr:hypothetical protein [Paenibacillus taihuensis]REE66663.1 hypothetical protein A8990_14931 [Paenibacillus taihuensis]